MYFANILLLLIVVLLSFLFIQKIFNYFKNRYFVAGFNLGMAKTMREIIKIAKEGKSFKVKDEQDEIKLIIITKKNAKFISNRSKRISG